MRLDRVKANGDPVLREEVDLCVCGPKTRAERGCECKSPSFDPPPRAKWTSEPQGFTWAVDNVEEAPVAGGHPGYMALLVERAALHMEKSSGYGTGEDPFANFTAVAQMAGQPRYLYPIHRTIEKLTRALSLHAQGRTGELEEEFKDCSSLLDCATAMLREDTGT